jgi:ankyrin repeat protein
LDFLWLLLDPGADLNAPTSHQMTPLHFAAFNGYFQVAEVSLVHGVDPQIRNEKGETAFDEASERGHLELAQLPSGHAGRGS